MVARWNGPAPTGQVIIHVTAASPAPVAKGRRFSIFSPSSRRRQRPCSQDHPPTLDGATSSSATIWFALKRVPASSCTTADASTRNHCRSQRGRKRFDQAARRAATGGAGRYPTIRHGCAGVATVKTNGDRLFATGTNPLVIVCMAFTRRRQLALPRPVPPGRAAPAAPVLPGPGGYRRQRLGRGRRRWNGASCVLRCLGSRSSLFACLARNWRSCRGATGTSS